MKGYKQFGKSETHKTNRGTVIEFRCFVPEKPEMSLEDISHILYKTEILVPPVIES